MMAAFHALLNRADNRRTCPGMTVTGAFLFTNKTNLVGEDKIVLL